MENKDFKIYVLEKEYPGSPKKGTIMMESYDDYYNPISSLRFSEKKLIEDYPDNWKLQEKPILKMISVINSDGYVSKGKEVLYRYMYGGYPDHQINSVVRTSDNEEFTVGDVIDTWRNKNVTIKYFKISNEGLYIKHSKGALFISLLNENGLLKIIKKSKPPLFTTEDGVDIFEPTRVWTVIKKGLGLVTCIPNEPMDGHLFFMDIEKAEEYIKMNKPKFSKNDIEKVLDSFSFGKELKNCFINKLENNGNS